MSTGLAEIRWLLFSICQIKYSIYSLNIPKKFDNLFDPDYNRYNKNL